MENSENSELQKETYDVIHTEPETIVFLSDNEQIAAIANNDLYPIIAFLRHRNATVREITEAYSAFSSSQDSKKKSDKSIYRYLKELNRLKLVDVVGQRVTKGQTATEKIWGRTARIFYVEHDLPDESVSIRDFCSEDCLACQDEGIHQNSLKGIALSHLLKHVLGDITEEVNYAEWSESLEVKIKDEIKVLVSKLSEQELRDISKLPYQAIDQILTVSSLMSLFKRKSKTLQAFYEVFDTNPLKD